jgi:pyrophosphatase PpaX
MTPSRPWAVLFDVDGTLLDTVEFILASVRYAFEGHPRPPTDEEWIAGIGSPLRVMAERFTSGPEEAARVSERYRAHQREHVERLTRPFDAAVDVVRELAGRGHPIGVVTGKTDATAARALALTGLAPYVGAIVGADSCPEHKPSPVPVLRALERLDRTPAEALFLGDSALDVQAGNAAGVVSVGALWGAATREALAAAGARHLLEDLAEMPALVARVSAAAP